MGDLPAVLCLMLARACLLLAFTGSTALNVATLAQNPFAEPLVERSQAELSVAFDRALRRTVDADWLLPRLEDAIAERDADTADVLARLADRQAIALPAETATDLADLQAEARSLLACATCALEVATCPDIPRIAMCNLPFELTPFGDANALRRAAQAHMTGQEVDGVDAALGAVGLTATFAVPISGGSSLTVKAGATLLRAARRARALAPRMTDELVALAAGVIRWDRATDVALRRAPVEALVDSARAARLTNVAADATKLIGNTSATDALAIVRMADTPDDLASLARLSDAAGEATRPGLHALGTARAVRLMFRVSEMTYLALGLLIVLASQIASTMGYWIARALTRKRRRKRRDAVPSPLGGEV